MISKELMSEVMQLGILEVGEVDDCYLSFKYYIQEGDNIQACINVYELAHKCKEWALSKRCYINSIYNEFWWDRIEKKYFADIPNKNKSFYADTEIEATIQACEWALDNKPL